MLLFFLSPSLLFVPFIHPSLSPTAKHFSFLWCFGYRWGLPRYCTDLDSHKVTGEYAPYLPPTEGRHSIQPLRCQRGDWDILGRLCFEPLLPLSQCVYVCIFQALHFPEKGPGFMSAWAAASDISREGWVFPAKSWAGGTALCVAVCEWVDSSHRNTIQ